MTVKCHGMTTHEDKLRADIRKFDEQIAKVLRKFVHVRRLGTNKMGVS